MKKLSNQISKNLDIKTPSYTGGLKSTRSPGKKVSVLSNRKKPPLIKTCGSENGSRMLRYPSNNSSKRGSQASQSNFVKKIVMPSKGKSNSLKRGENTPLTTANPQ